MSTEQETIPPVEVPVGALSSEVLTEVIESFIFREGTDYGAQEASLSSKVSQIRAQIEKGDVKIVFDPASESVHLLTKTEFQRFSKSQD